MYQRKLYVKISPRYAIEIDVIPNRLILVVSLLIIFIFIAAYAKAIPLPGRRTLNRKYRNWKINTELNDFIFYGSRATYLTDLVVFVIRWQRSEEFFLVLKNCSEHFAS